MEVIKCNECGKELSSKAEICPNCGVKIKKKGFKEFIGKTFKFFEIIGGLIVIALIILFGYYGIKKIVRENTRKSYVGVWELQTNVEKIPYDYKYNDNPPLYDKLNIIVPTELDLLDEYVWFGDTGGIQDNHFTLGIGDNEYISIKFSTDDKNYKDRTVLMCFKRDKDTLTQVSCKDSGESNWYGGYSGSNNIVYKKIK